MSSKHISLDSTSLSNIHQHVLQQKGARAFATSRWDNMNSPQSKVSAAQFKHLQLTQDNAVWMVSKQKSRHITPVLTNLHWLPVHRHIAFKPLFFRPRLREWCRSGLSFFNAWASPTHLSDLSAPLPGLAWHLPLRETSVLNRWVRSGSNNYRIDLNYIFNKARLYPHI